VLEHRRASALEPRVVAEQRNLAIATRLAAALRARFPSLAK
jgi:hypothetical protein